MASTTGMEGRAEGGVKVSYRLICTDRMDLGAKHHRGEDEEEEALKAQEDEEDDCCWRWESTALWGGRGEGNHITLSKGNARGNHSHYKQLLLVHINRW